MRFVDFPKAVSATDYSDATQRLQQVLQSIPGIVAAWQIGSVGSPGISDLDFVILFEDDARYLLDVRTSLPDCDRYLLIHTPFAATTSTWEEARAFSLLHNYRPLLGTPPRDPKPLLDDHQLAILRRQIALEYLLRIFASLTCEITYGILRVRNLLLHAKAMLYDCEYLGVPNGRLAHALAPIIQLRSSWFSELPPPTVLKELVRSLHQELASELAAQLASAPLFVPPRANYRFARNMVLENHPSFQVLHSGFPLPSALAGLGRPYFNLQHRLNSFRFRTPLQTHSTPPPLERLHAVRQSLLATMRRQFPTFIPLTSGLAFQS